MRKYRRNYSCSFHTRNVYDVIRTTLVCGMAKRKQNREREARYCIYISWNGLTPWKILRIRCNHCFYLQRRSVVCASLESIDSTFARDFVL